MVGPAVLTLHQDTFWLGELRYLGALTARQALHLASLDVDLSVLLGSQTSRGVVSLEHITSTFLGIISKPHIARSCHMKYKLQHTINPTSPICWMLLFHSQLRKYCLFFQRVLISELNENKTVIYSFNSYLTFRLVSNKIILQFSSPEEDISNLYILSIL